MQRKIVLKFEYKDPHPFFLFRILVKSVCSHVLCMNKYFGTFTFTYHVKSLSGFPGKETDIVAHTDTKLVNFQYRRKERRYCMQLTPFMESTQIKSKKERVRDMVEEKE